MLQAANRMEVSPPPPPSFPHAASLKPNIQELDVDAMAAQAAGDEINREI